MSPKEAAASMRSFPVAGRAAGPQFFLRSISRVAPLTVELLDHSRPLCCSSAMAKPSANSLIFRVGSPSVRSSTSSASRGSFLVSPNAKPTQRGFSASVANRIIASKLSVESSSAIATLRIAKSSASRASQFSTRLPDKSCARSENSQLRWLTRSCGSNWWYAPSILSSSSPDNAHCASGKERWRLSNWRRAPHTGILDVSSDIDRDALESAARAFWRHSGVMFGMCPTKSTQCCGSSCAS